jgi:hypothetical protein
MAEQISAMGEAVIHPVHLVANDDRAGSQWRNRRSLGSSL